jgi:hypothetical protein
VLWFYSKGKIVVCTNGVNKKGTMDEGEIRHAETIEELFGRAVANSTIEIVDYTEFAANKDIKEKE